MAHGQGVDADALTHGFPSRKQQKIIDRKDLMANRQCANPDCHQILSIHNPDQFCSLCKRKRLDTKTIGSYSLADELESRTESTKRLKAETLRQQK